MVYQPLESLFSKQCSQYTSNDLQIDQNATSMRTSQCFWLTEALKFSLQFGIYQSKNQITKNFDWPFLFESNSKQAVSFFISHQTKLANKKEEFWRSCFLFDTKTLSEKKIKFDSFFSYTVTGR